MKKHRLFILVAAGVCAGAIAIAQTQTSPAPNSAPDPAVSALERQVAALQATVKTLEARLAKVESELPPKGAPIPLQLIPNNPAVTPPANVNPPGIVPGSGTPPKIWGSGEINGWTYYIVPCGAQAK